jgi:hypothetical protein
VTAKIQTLPTMGFTPHSGTGRIPEVKATLGAAIDAGLRRLTSGGQNARLTYRVEPLSDGSMQIVIGKAAKNKTAPADIETALAAARTRGATRVAEILAGPDMLGADDFAASLGVTRQSLHVKRKKRQVLGLAGAKRGYRFPIWQVGADGKPFAALPALFEALSGPWAVYRFLQQVQPELGMTGLAALQQGLDDQAVELARNIERSSA